MNLALRAWVWLTTTWPGAIASYGAVTWLVGEAFRSRTDAQWNELKALAWPWRLYLFWARFWSFVGATCRRVGIDGPAIRRAVLGAVLTKGLAERLPGDAPPGPTAGAEPPFDGRGSTWPILPKDPPGSA